ncbi:MAG: LUD domain-containing protein [Elusimicrobiota bacterium]|nr:LUD domain-containing protein [Elusimicrobiota bacterium]
MDEYSNKFYKKQLETVQKNLVANGFKNTVIFEDTNSMVDYVTSLIGTGKKIGIGGSQSVRLSGLLENLKSKGNEIITHTHDMNVQTRRNVWLAAQQADFYLASPQAVTFDGELIFLDAYGNRVSAIIFGPSKVLLICGRNKLVKDIETGIWRSRNIAAVKNNIRLGRENPCVKTGKCENCNSQQRICNILVVLHKKPTFTEYEIMLVNQELGY